MQEPLVSCLCSTYGRYNVLQEAISCFLEQDYENKELIVLNNHPVPLEADLPQVTIVNKPGHPTLGDCRNALLEMANGELVRTWDDDDLYLPWAISQGVKGLFSNDVWQSFKPEKSWDCRGNNELRLGSNVYEASWTTYRDAIVKIGGYKSSGGDEHNPLSFKLIHGSKKVRPSYIYRWASGLHRISGKLGSYSIEKQHEEHCQHNQDHGNGKPLEKCDLSKYWRMVEDAEKTFFDSWTDK